MKDNEKHNDEENKTVFMVSESGTKRTTTSICNNYEDTPDADREGESEREGATDVGATNESEREGATDVGAANESERGGATDIGATNESERGEECISTDATMADEIAPGDLECGEEESYASASDASETPVQTIKRERRAEDLLINISRDDFEQQLREAYERGRNEAIEARIIADSHTALTDNFQNDESFPFLTGRKSVWGNK